MFCKDCKKRDVCSRICPELEKHLAGAAKSQRERSHSELLPRHPSSKAVADPFDKASFRYWNADDISWQEVVQSADGQEYKYNFPGVSDLQKRCLYLFHVEGLKYSQIAQRVNKKTSVVRGQIARARAKLKAKV